MPYAIGVDGGASNCRVVLTTLDGEVLHVAKGPGVNYHEAGASNALATMRRLCQQCLSSSRARDEECQAFCFGLAGVGRESDRSRLAPLLDNQFGKGRYLLMSDAEIALASGTLSDRGILVLAGTGSMVYGKNESGATARIGGYGPILSDEGGGYRIGQDALRAAIRSYDGCGEPTALTAWILEQFNLQHEDEMISWVNSSNCTREKIASIAQLAIRAAEEDDIAADAILHRHADWLAVAVHALRQKLDMPDVIDVVLNGGLLSQSNLYWQIARRKILYLLPGANVIVPKLEPMLGAALYALAESGVEISDDLVQTLKRSYLEWTKKAADKTEAIIHGDSAQDHPMDVEEPNGKPPRSEFEDAEMEDAMAPVPQKSLFEPEDASPFQSENAKP